MPMTRSGATGQPVSGDLTAEIAETAA